MHKNQVVTFGCRLNIYESEVIKEAIETSGESNLVVFNTCSVTKEAERQAKQAIRKAKRENPDIKVIVTGCAAQLNPQKYASMPEVDKVVGNEEKFEAKNYLSENAELNDNKILVNDIMSVKETAGHLVNSFEGRARAFLQIQNGCNHRCTFCIIPYARGNSRSVPIGTIVTNVKSLIKAGYNEVVLTGVDISDYGLDLPGSPSLADMIKRLLALVPDLKRLRLSSIDVAEIDEDLFELIARDERIMPHIHISLQAGDNMILKRMKRRHNRQQVIDFCAKLRKIRPNVAFGADIIAGFPTETEEMFENSLKLIEEADLQYLHVFPYSERENTPAARMPQVEKNIRKERAKLLREKGEENLRKFMERNIGTLTFGIIEKDNIARCENFLQVQLDGNFEEGSLHRIYIEKIENNQLVGKVI